MQVQASCLNDLNSQNFGRVLMRCEKDEEETHNASDKPHGVHRGTLSDEQEAKKKGITECRGEWVDVPGPKSQPGGKSWGERWGDRWHPNSHKVDAAVLPSRNQNTAEPLVLFSSDPACLRPRGVDVCVSWWSAPLSVGGSWSSLNLSLWHDALVARGRLGCCVAPITAMARDLRRCGVDEL